MINQKVESKNGVDSTYNYEYDSRGRLTTVTKDNQVVESYTYDNNGNRISATVDGVTTTAYYTLDDQTEVYGDNTYTYDQDGQLISKQSSSGTTTYSYNTYGALTDVTLEDGTTIKYHLNPLGQRVAKEVNGVVTEKYLWENLTTLLAILDADDNLVQRYNYSDERVPTSLTQDNQTYYLHYDQVGTLKVVTDENHNIVKEITYDTYGNILNDSNPNFTVPFGFAGGVQDRDTKLVHFGYREYDPYTAKWTSKDPIDFSGGDTNLYGYVLNDPVNFVDPEGLKGLMGEVGEQVLGYSYASGLEYTGMNSTMAGIIGEGLTASTVAALGSGPFAPIAAVLAFPVGVTEGLIYEAFFADDLENLLDYLDNDFSELTCP
jgi:RHS repeat-associated protein